MGRVKPEFIVCVRPRLCCLCYLGQYGLVAWAEGAKRFATVEDANVEIKARGWTNSVDQLPQTTTAYCIRVDGDEA